MSVINIKTESGSVKYALNVEKYRSNEEENIILLFNEHQIYKISQDEAKTKDISIKFKGGGNTLILNEKTRFKNCRMLFGTNTKVFIDQTKDVLQNLTVDMKNSGGCLLYIGKNFLCGGLYCKLKEGRTIYIGDDCMFSFDICIWNSDCHAILSDGNCINYGQDVVISNHVWIGHGVEILKGTNIAEGCIVGAKALLNKKFERKNCIIAGFPAKIIRENVSWDRRSPSKFK